MSKQEPVEINDLEKDSEKALRLLRLAANQGNVVSQHNLGVMYLTAKIVTQDYDQSVKWFQKAADLEYAPAQYALGYMYAVLSW